MPPVPSAVRRALNFRRAVARRLKAEAAAAAGLAGGEEAGLRTPAEIRAIFAEHCAQCPGGYFDGEICRHRDCGCNVTDDTEAKLNKLAWRSEHCPIGQW